jgi:hypothetical protein
VTSVFSEPLTSDGPRTLANAIYLPTSGDLRILDLDLPLIELVRRHFFRWDFFPFFST